MFNRARYIHYIIPQYGFGHRKFNGFSVLLSPYSDTFVSAQLVMCSKVDHFSRATARTLLTTRASDLIAIKYLPEYLNTLENKVWGFPDESKQASNKWAWVWKYFI